MSVPEVEHRVVAAMLNENASTIETLRIPSCSPKIFNVIREPNSYKALCALCHT
jgi:hypothetical protein